MQITLPPEIQAIIEHEIDSGRFDTPEAVVIEALRHLQDDATPAIPDEWLSEARAQADRGETVPWTDELRAAIRRQAKDDARLGKPVSDEVRY